MLFLSAGLESILWKTLELWFALASIFVDVWMNSRTPKKRFWPTCSLLGVDRPEGRMQHFLCIPWSCTGFSFTLPTSALKGREGESPVGGEDRPVPSQIIVILLCCSSGWRMRELLGTLTKSTRTSSQDGRQLRRCAAAQLRHACDSWQTSYGRSSKIHAGTFSIRVIFADMIKTSKTCLLPQARKAAKARPTPSQTV